MIRLLAFKVGFVVLLILLGAVLFLWQNNRLLTEKNRILEKTSRERIQTITIQKKVLAVVKNSRATNLAGNIKRMQDGQL